ncbi:hypothetical protein [Cardinium endosymbiont of Philonthus spinipes]|uniref:hypothetical protein n=1 Tax=Cardinium endosymbiont of Philonthus spinipes TaxID=3077941 RepID=UPI00313BB464
MKIKIALLGLFFANSIIHPTYADPYAFELEEDDLDISSSVEKDDLTAKEAEKDNPKAENLIKLGAAITMSPAIVYQDKALTTKNGVGAQLKFTAAVPKALCNKDAAVDIGAGWNEKSFTIKNATVAIGERVTMGYTSSIFGYEKADPSLLISATASTLQIKYEYTFDWFRFGYALERAMPLHPGLFNKNNVNGQQYNTKEEGANSAIQLDDLKNKDRPFKAKNSFPAFGINLGVVMDELNIGLSALGRCTDYTHSSHSNEKNLPNIHYVTYGGHFGVQYQVVPKKFTATGQGVYVHGLGDYLSGLSAIQSDETRKEMCAVYYIDQDKDRLYAIDAWGFGGTLEYCATPKWTLSIRGSFLTTGDDLHKPAQAFHSQWNLVPKVAYAINKYLTLSGGYSLVKELKVEEQQNKGMEHKFSGGIKFSL